MSINVNVGNIIPTNVVEVGNEISVNQLAAITAADSPSAINPFATASHLHTIANISGLQTAIDGKANLSHTHVITNITGLQTALDGKSPSSHLHEISGVTGLLDALDGKANLSHTHIISDVTGLQTALNAKANTTHTQAIGSIIFLQATLDSKANLSHTHVISDVTGLQTALDGKLSASHNHDGVYAKLTGDTFSGEIKVPEIANLLNTDLVIDSYNDTGAGTHYYHKFTPFDGKFVLAPNGGGLVFPDATTQSTASYSKAQSDAHLATVATWVNTKADLGHTHVIADVTGLQTAIDSASPFPQSWIEGGDMARLFTIEDGVLTWDGSTTISNPLTGPNAGDFVFNKKLALPNPSASHASLNIGSIDSNLPLTSSVAGDVWMGRFQLTYKNAQGSVVYGAATNITNIFGSPQIIDTTHNSTPALRITQKGTGHSLVVEDATTPDSTPFIINATGQTLIGRTTAPNSSVGLSVANGIHVQSGTGTTTAIQILGNIDASSQQTNANTTSISSEYTEEWQVIINGQLAYIPFRR
jgi:hypothetical protein